MPTVFVPPLVRPLVGGKTRLAASGDTVAAVINSLEASHPGIRDRLLVGDQLRPGLSVVIDGMVSSRGLRTRVSPGSEVHFIPAVGGG